MSWNWAGETRVMEMAGRWVKRTVSASRPGHGQIVPDYSFLYVFNHDVRTHSGGLFVHAGGLYVHGSGLYVHS